MTSKAGLKSRAVNAVIRGLLRACGVSLSEQTLALSSHDDLHEALDAAHREGNFDKEDRDRLSGLFELEEPGGFRRHEAPHSDAGGECRRSAGSGGPRRARKPLYAHASLA